MDEFLLHAAGYRRQQSAEWDRTRHIMWTVVKAAGAKSIGGVQDVMRLPLIDDVGENAPENIRERLRKRLEQRKQSNGG